MSTNTSEAVAERGAERAFDTSRAGGPTWASALGVVIILMGVLLTATHANEWLKHSVIAYAAPAGELAAADCPEDELEEEGLTVAECEYMVSRLQGLIHATPPWFAGWMSILAAIGTLVAFATIFIGSALMSLRRWASPAAAAALFVLLTIDAGVFVAALNAGPIIRDLYLWSTLLWLVVHLVLFIGSVVGWRSSAVPHASGPAGAY